MFRLGLVFVSAIMLVSTASAQSITATFTLESTRNGQTVASGSTVDWTIKASLPAGTSAGLAFACVDLVQGTTNASYFDILPAASVPSAMANFSRPLGVSNPGEGGTTTGYIGVQRSPTGQTYKNLIQIGGGQNTFGVATASGTGAGESATVVSGIALGTSVVIASGSFTAPSVAGSYELHLANGMANVLTAGTPPVSGQPWPILSTDVVLSSAVFTFQVSASLRGDMNCDGVVNTADISHFVQALIDPAGYDADHDGSPYTACQRTSADLNQDGVEDGRDVQRFVSTLIGA